jgi:hypothetical protein
VIEGMWKAISNKVIMEFDYAEDDDDDEDQTEDLILF